MPCSGLSGRGAARIFQRATNGESHVVINIDKNKKKTTTTHTGEALLSWKTTGFKDRINRRTELLREIE